MLPGLRVVYVVLVAVGFPLKTPAVIGLVVRVERVLLLEAPADEFNDVLNTIPQVERHVQHFAHLHRVDVLVS